MSQRYKQAKFVTLLGACMNVFLGALKLFGGFCYASPALVADGFHSFADLLTDAMVVFASKYGSLDADDNHPYGHQRIETAATFFLALLLILTGIGITWDAAINLSKIAQPTLGYITLPIAALSVAMNEGLFHYTRYIGQKINSSLLIANAWHHRSDAGASLVAGIGILGSMLGMHILDPIAAMVIGCLIIKMGIEYGWHSINELVDASVDKTTLAKITATLNSIEGVIKIHQLRTRMMGPDIFVDVHILVSSQISVSEGHFIAQNVHYTLLKTLTQIKDVTVHVDPEDDEHNIPKDPPSRATLEKAFILGWQKDYPKIEYWNIHYLSDSITIDIIIAHDCSDYSILKARILRDIAKYKPPIAVRLLNHLTTIDILSPDNSFV